MELGDEAIGVYPDARALGQDVAIHRERLVQVRAEQAIVFRRDTAKVGAQPRHTAASIGQERQRRARCGGSVIDRRLGGKETHGRGGVTLLVRGTFQLQFRIASDLRRGETDDVAPTRRDAGKVLQIFAVP